MHSFDVSGILSIDENKIADNAIKIYPNPATSEFTISQNLSSEGTVQLFDLSGKKIKELFKGNFGTNENITVKTDGIAAGVYLVKIKNGYKSATKKLVINK